jgi:ABC-type molybdate transport system substrate-binding protein
MVAGLSARTERSAAAQAFVDFLLAPSNSAVVTAKGMER